ncbi:C-type lectin domain family 4 member M-like isoform X1 [Astatotilapia calliptera]|uniref:C-type lectin domain family 4 member M-like isoform X1 n=1 Tax=Astatotilapia calliptera TaxID=8154 RepID=UPI000E429D88|nr:C-type lectin domain family 4 member M-like isoform X1 [Astatotilapia calliptera]
MTFEKISQDFSTDGHSVSHRQRFRQGLFADGSRPAFPHHRLVILSLSLLNAVLLIAAVVTGIYCVKAKDFQVSDSSVSPLLIEMNHLRNHSGIIKERLEAQAKLVKERTNHVQLKLQVKQLKVENDLLQRQIETLNAAKSNLQTNKTLLEETCGRCPTGWLLLKTSCYYFSHHEINSRKNWTESRQYCINQGGDLLVINNLEEQLLITDNFQKVSSSGVWWQNGYWVGLTDVVTEGTWVWVNNVTEVDSMYWRSGQPDSSGEEKKNCAAFLFFTDNVKTWYNVECSSKQLNWICEMEPKQTTRGPQ